MQSQLEGVQQLALQNQPELLDVGRVDHAARHGRQPGVGELVAVPAGSDAEVVGLLDVLPVDFPEEDGDPEVVDRALEVAEVDVASAEAATSE